MKVKRVKTKKNIIKSNWDEDDVSATTSNVLMDIKKSKNTTKHFETAAQKTSKTVKIKKKKIEQGVKNGSSNDEFGASLDKLKEIDPDFYKVMTKFCIVNNKTNK